MCEEEEEEEVQETAIHMASHKARMKGPGAAAQGLTPVAGDADLTSCPNCYLYFDYQVKGNNNLVPRLLSCGHLVCST